MKVIVSILSTILLIITSIITVWWIYFPLALILIFLFKKTYSVLFAGIILDSIYFESGYRHFPLLFVTSFFVVVLFILLKDKLRYAF